MANRGAVQDLWAVYGRRARPVRRVLLGAVGVLLLTSSAAMAAPTHPVTIGANLAQAPNVSFDCSIIPFEFSGPGTGGPSCTWGNPIGPNSSGGLDVPGTGTVYRVKLRVGATTGRMQLVVLRTLFDPQDIVNNQCCIAQGRSSIFTPVRNGITTLNVTLPVAEDDSPTATVDFLDQIGLSILEDHVTIPLINETGLPINEQPVDTFNAPAMTLGENQLASDPDGYVLDMQADWYPPGQSPAVLALPAQPVTINGTNAAVPMNCTLAPCVGNLTIQSAPAGGAGDRASGASAAKVQTFASGHFRVAAGKRESVPATLTSLGRTLARQHKTVRVEVVATVTDVKPARKLTRILTLKF